MSTQIQPSLLSNVSPLPSREGRGVCHSCGQKLPVIHKHNLSKGLVNFLWHLYYAGKPTKLNDLGLDNNTFANAQKVAYFNLAYSVDGYWRLTQSGPLFLANRIEIEKYVLTKKGKVVERGPEKIKVCDVDEGWQAKADYARESVPV